MSEVLTVEGVKLRIIPDTAGNYAISKCGRVRSLQRRVHCENGHSTSTRVVKARWMKQLDKAGVKSFEVCVEGKTRHLNLKKTLSLVWGLGSMTRDERSLALYFESVAVDQDGAIDARRMNAADFEIAERWNREGFIRFGRVHSSDLKQSRTHWVELSPEAWAIAQEERRARGQRGIDRKSFAKNPPRAA